MLTSALRRISGYNMGWNSMGCFVDESPCTHGPYRHDLLGYKVLQLNSTGPNQTQCGGVYFVALQSAPLDSDRETEAAALDDAEATGDGISDQDFTRGKRFRKLHRLLNSTVVRTQSLSMELGHTCMFVLGCSALHLGNQVAGHQRSADLSCFSPCFLILVPCLLQIQRPVERLRLIATLIAAALAAIHLGMFVLMFKLMGQQSDLVNNLGLIGEHVVSGKLTGPAWLMYA
jgi:hypothetical protein